MHKHLIILHLMGQWWRMEVNTELATDPNIPLYVVQLCNVIYDITTKTMIKNKFRPEQNLGDVIVLRLWLGDDLPTFIYKGHKKLDKDFSEWDRMGQNKISGIM